MTKLDQCMRSAEDYCRARPPADIVQEVCRGLADVANRWQAYFPADLEAMLARTRQELVLHRQRITELRMAVLDGEKTQMLRERLGYIELEGGFCSQHFVPDQLPGRSA